MRAVSLAAALALCARPAAALTTNTAGASAEFLRIGAGARALGMGEAYGPVAEGAEAIYWNPAGLAQAAGPELTYSHVEMLRFFHHEHIAYAHPVRFLRGTLGGALTLFYQDSQDLVTNTNQTVGRFNAHSESYALGYATAFGVGEDYAARDRDYFLQAWNLPGAYRPLERDNDFWTGSLMLGAAIKGVSETIYNRSARAFAVDAGAIFRPSELPQLSLSATLRNAGTELKFVRVFEKLPMELDLGVAYNVLRDSYRFIPVFEVAVPYYGDPYGKLGLEYGFRFRDSQSLWVVRAGYNSLSAPDLGPLTGLTGGIGVRMGKLSLDVAFKPMAELGEVYRGSASWRF